MLSVNLPPLTGFIYLSPGAACGVLRTLPAGISRDDDIVSREVPFCGDFRDVNPHDAGLFKPHAPLHGISPYP